MEEEEAHQRRTRRLRRLEQCAPGGADPVAAEVERGEGAIDPGRGRRLLARRLVCGRGVGDGVEDRRLGGDLRLVAEAQVGMGYEDHNPPSPHSHNEPPIPLNGAIP